MFGDILYSLIIGPLETLFEVIYVCAYHFTEDQGTSIICLSLVMNFLLLPLYNRTDAIQAQANETEKRMAPAVRHIKKAFRGNEQYMMLQTYYRQNGYKPADVLKGIAPLALEIPFFMAAYHYLSHLDHLAFAHFGAISNLARPDQLLTIGGEQYNLLPIAMTVINILSSLIYTKGAPLKTKLQLYGMAAVFLVLLYNSPSALVLYWTLNNLFSLVKNLFMKLPRPGKIFRWMLAASGIGLLVRLILHFSQLSMGGRLLLLLAAGLLALPLVLQLSGKGATVQPGASGKAQNMGFFTAQLLLTLVIGALIPSALINSSPEEFIIWSRSVSIHSYVLHCTVIAAGFFLIWMTVFYSLLKPAGRRVMECIAWCCSICCIVNYMFFGRNYGLLSNQLVFERGVSPSEGEIVLNLVILAAVSGAAVVVSLKKPELMRILGAAAVISVLCLSGFNMLQTQNKVTDDLQMNEALTQPDSLFQLNRNGKNVVVLMLDRAVGALVPYIFEEKPELCSQFEGFTYYPNTLSFGAHTNFGLPAVLGGYEYTPQEMDKRNQEKNVDKHNEALRMMPVLFSSQGFDTTVCDPTYADYRWTPRTDIYDSYPQIHAHITKGAYSNNSAEDVLNGANNMKRNILFYSLFKCAPVGMHSYLYDNGSYRNLQTGSSTGQTNESPVTAEGENIDFADSYSVLKYLPALTEVTDDSRSTFMMMCNDTTHSPQLLQLPDYKPSLKVDNREFEQEIPQRTNGAGELIELPTPVQMTHYHCNMAAYLQLGKWFEYLKAQGVYDNTRIILVSDHGYWMRLRKEHFFGPAYEDEIVSYNPILLVKDFDSRAPFHADEMQMTNADVPSLAVENLIADPVNPFTGNPIDNTHTKEGAFYVILSHQFYAHKNNGTTFLPDPWAVVSGDMWDRSNWIMIGPEPAS